MLDNPDANKLVDTFITGLKRDLPELGFKMVDPLDDQFDTSFLYKENGKEAIRISTWSGTWKKLQVRILTDFGPMNDTALKAHIPSDVIHKYDGPDAIISYYEIVGSQLSLKSVDFIALYYIFLRMIVRMMKEKR